jgi:hypothetical protein
LRRLIALSMLACLAPLGAQAEPLLTVNGNIKAPNPATMHAPGITETLSPCGSNLDPQIPQGALQGVDGFWLTLTSAVRGHEAVLTPEQFNSNNQSFSGQLLAYFYDASCNLIKPPDSAGTGPKHEDAYSMATHDPVPPFQTQNFADVVTVEGDDVKTNTGARDLYPAVRGTIPTNASFVIITMYVGQDANFTFVVPN